MGSRNANDHSEAENLRYWMKMGEHGASSCTMFNHLNDEDLSMGPYESVPHDPDDFRRCHMLLEAVPQWRGKLDKLKPLSTEWAALVDNWDKLTEMLLDQLKTKPAKPNGMYEFMCSLRNISDSRIEITRVK